MQLKAIFLSFLADNNDHDIDLLVWHIWLFLANDEEKERMKVIFLIVREYLLSSVNQANKRAVFSRTLLGTIQLLELERWVIENSDALVNCETPSEILQMIIPKLVECSENRCLKAVTTKIEIPSIANMWINGMSYKQILEYATENVMIIRRKKKRTAW